MPSLLRARGDSEPPGPCTGSSLSQRSDWRCCGHFSTSGSPNCASEFFNSKVLIHNFRNCQNPQNTAIFRTRFPPARSAEILSHTQVIYSKMATLNNLLLRQAYKDLDFKPCPSRAIEIFKFKVWALLLFCLSALVWNADMHTIRTCHLRFSRLIYWKGSRACGTPRGISG